LANTEEDDHPAQQDGPNQMDVDASADVEMEVGAMDNTGW
jgi:hypothetical protein